MQLRSLLADAAAEAYYEPRHVIDILQDYWQPWSGGEALPVPELLAALRPLIPRLYSISSSPLEHPTRVQVGSALPAYGYARHNQMLCGIRLQTEGTAE